MEVVSKKRLTTKISKIDRDLKHLEQFLSEGIVKETLMAEMKNKKRPLNREMNQELKKQKQKQEPESWWKGKIHNFKLSKLFPTASYSNLRSDQNTVYKLLT